MAIMKERRGDCHRGKFKGDDCDDANDDEDDGNKDDGDDDNNDENDARNDDHGEPLRSSKSRRRLSWGVNSRVIILMMTMIII